MHPNFFLREMKNLAFADDFGFLSEPKDFTPLNEWEQAYCTIEVSGVRGTFQIQQMPGCCAVLVVFFVRPIEPTRENFLKILSKIEVAAKSAGFGSLLMAQVGTEADWNWMFLAGWILSEPFTNAKSGNKVLYLTKDLGQPGKVSGLEF
jgi:hypothetical protein